VVEGPDSSVAVEALGLVMLLTAIFRDIGQV
jgi:hypothetical protein